MKLRRLMPLVFAWACSETIPAPRAIVSVEGGGSVVDVRTLNGPFESIFPEHVERLRHLAGNQAVYVVDRDRDGAHTIWIISIWETPRALEQCAEAGLCSGRAETLNVLYSTTQ
jgi:hypothetical protein